MLYFIQCGNFHIEKYLLDMEPSFDDFSLDFNIIIWTFRCRNCNWGRYATHLSIPWIPNCPSRKEPSVPEHRTNLHFQTSNQHLKRLMLFWVVVRISCLQTGQFVQMGLSSSIWAISIFRVYQTKFSDFLILKLNVDFELEPTNAKWQSEMAK